jgi:hypothetical protein
LGLLYVAFGLVRATVLGLMERQETALGAEEQLAEGGDLAEAAPLDSTAVERRAGWGDRRQKPEE